MKYPLLHKQNTGTTGGAGIVRIDSLDEMEQVLESESNDKCPQGCFIQQYIFGQAAGMNARCGNGNIIAHTILIGIGETISFGSPSLVRLIKNKAIFTTGKKLLKALNWNGVVNIDFVIDQDNNEAWVLEINPRYWASLLCSTVSGINFPYLACLMAMGEDFQKPEYQCMVAGPAAEVRDYQERHVSAS